MFITESVMTRDVKIKVGWFSSEHRWKRKNLWISAENDWISMRARPGLSSVLHQLCFFDIESNLSAACCSFFYHVALPLKNHSLNLRLPAVSATLQIIKTVLLVTRKNCMRYIPKVQKNFSTIRFPSEFMAPCITTVTPIVIYSMKDGI